MLREDSGSREENPFTTPFVIGLGEGREGLGDAFGNCMPRLLRVADCILHNHHDSEDALQDSLLSALRHLDQFQGNSQLSTWLYSIVRNAALGKLRRQRAHPVLSLDEHGSDDESEIGALEFLSDPHPDPEIICSQSELRSKFARILKKLPANYQAIIRLCDFEGFSGREAARMLGLTVSALKAQHHRARLAMREHLEAAEGEVAWTRRAETGPQAVGRKGT
jgi:RNA polymerase sigma-70 factor, ECF subfamily